MCVWGVMKPTVEAASCGKRPAKIVALGAAMSKMAIITAPKMLEGFVKKAHILVVNAGTMHERLEAVRRGDVAAGNFMEPWISIAQKQGFRILMESHSTRSEAASDDLDGPTLAAMFRAEAKAAALINANPARYAHYLVAEAQGLLAPPELQTWRLLYGPPMPYTRGRFAATYVWMLSYPELITPGATYETAVDNRAWV